MTIFDFIALTNDEQLDTVGTMGVYLSSRSTAAHRITLYGINDFYVEVYFHLQQLEITMLSAIRGDRIDDLYHDITPLATHKPGDRKDYHPVDPNLTFPDYLRSSLS